MPTPSDRSGDPVLDRLAARICACRACPRLARYLEESRIRWPDHRGLPVPGWGDPDPRILIVGLAPGVHGANRTGRMFTWDSSGQWLYPALHRHGFATRPVSSGPGDGLELRKAWITAAARCAPPQNRPSGPELAACRPFLVAELAHFHGLRVLLALGRIAHEALLKGLDLRAGRYPFRHAAEHELPDGRILLDSYHPSRQNTNTGRLTASMWDAVFARARTLSCG